MNFSEQPETAPNGGDMGFVGESQMHADPAIFTAITKLKAGEVTEILPLLDGQTKKPVGYAIYKLLSRDPPGQRDLNDPRVQQAIRQQLRDGRSQLLKARLPGDGARSGEGGELLRRTDLQERRALTNKTQAVWRVYDAVTGAFRDSWLWTPCGSPPSACVCAVQRGDADRDVAAGPGGCRDKTALSTRSRIASPRARRCVLRPRLMSC